MVDTRYTTQFIFISGRMDGWVAFINCGLNEVILPALMLMRGDKTVLQSVMKYWTGGWYLVWIVMIVNTRQGYQLLHRYRAHMRPVWTDWARPCFTFWNIKELQTIIIYQTTALAFTENQNSHKTSSTTSGPRSTPLLSTASQKSLMEGIIRYLERFY